MIACSDGGGDAVTEGYLNAERNSKFWFDPSTRRFHSFEESRPHLSYAAEHDIPTDTFVRGAFEGGGKHVWVASKDLSALQLVVDIIRDRIPHLYSVRVYHGHNLTTLETDADFDEFAALSLQESIFSALTRT